MKFYTNVAKRGNSILYRGYDNGVKVQNRVDFEPTLFVPSRGEISSKSQWHSLYGEPVRRRKFASMRDASEFLERMQGAENITIHGNTDYIAQYIQENFPGDIEFDLTAIQIDNIDIEVESDEGFPEPDVAAYPIVSITYKTMNDNRYYVWGLKDYDAFQTELELEGNEYIVYEKCPDEKTLLAKFLIHLAKSYPDIITGYYIAKFDIPYLIQRLINVLGEKAANALSPWSGVKVRKIDYPDGTVGGEIPGIAILDFYELFKKFDASHGNLESYTLNHVGHVVLGEKKLSYAEYSSLANLYKENHQKFIDYNIRDVQIVQNLIRETGLMDLAITLSYRMGINYSDVFGTVKLWDTMIYRYLSEKKVATPPKPRSGKIDYPGGYVKDPRVGMSEWIVSMDLNSLYPNLIVEYNMSPETIVKTEKVVPNGVDHFLENTPEIDEDLAVAANGVCFRKDKLGILPEIVMKLYSERKIVKGKMLEVDKEIQGAPEGKKASLKAMKNIYHNQQYALKIALNSLYGACGNRYFRYYDPDIAEAITLSGQLAIRWAEKSINKYLDGILGNAKDRVIAIDTDSVYLDMSDLVEKIKPKNPVDFLSRIFSEKMEPMVKAAYEELSGRQNAYAKRMVMSRESIASRGVWTAKKRYILYVHDNEGVRYSTPKIKIMGVEAIKSSTPDIVRNRFKEAFEIILNGKESDLQEFVTKFEKEFSNLQPEDLSFPRGISDIEKWKSNGDQQSSLMDTSNIITYKKGTPIHVRGGIIYNHLLDNSPIGKNMSRIKNGTKVKFCYLVAPNPITGKENVISFPDFLPRELGAHEFIDHKTQFEKCFKDPLNLITNPIGWSLDKKSSLESFFG